MQKDRREELLNMLDAVYDAAEQDLAFHEMVRLSQSFFFDDVEQARIAGADLADIESSPAKERHQQRIEQTLERSALDQVVAPEPGKLAVG